MKVESCGRFAERTRSKITTWYPCETRSATHALPSFPEPPVTTTRVTPSPSEGSLQREIVLSAQPEPQPKPRRPLICCLRRSAKYCVACDCALHSVGRPRRALPYLGPPRRVRCDEPQSRLLGRVRGAAHRCWRPPRGPCAGLHHWTRQRFAGPGHRSAGRLGGRPKR